MRFQAEHRFHGSPDAVVALLADPDFYVNLALPDVSSPALLDRHVEGTVTVLRLRYEFEGGLDPTARRLVGRNRLVWIQELSVDSSSYRGRLTYRAEADPRRIHGSADFVLTADGDTTVRRLTGDLVVAVPIVGSWAEKKIQPGLLRRLDIEAQTLDAKLRGLA